MTNKLSRFWTAIADTDSGPRFFHMVANGDALFTSDVADTFRCTDEADAIELCEALEETSASGWRPIFLAPQDPQNLPDSQRMQHFWIIDRSGKRVGKLTSSTKISR